MTERIAIVVGAILNIVLLRSLTEGWPKFFKLPASSRMRWSVAFIRVGTFYLLFALAGLDMLFTLAYSVMLILIGFLLQPNKEQNKGGAD